MPAQPQSPALPQCPNDTNGDGDCHLCVRTGGCPLRGGCAAAVFVAPRTDRALRVIYNADPESSEAQRARDELRSIEATLNQRTAYPALMAALRDIFAMMDEGILVRDISHDAEEGWTTRALDMTRRLAKAMQALAQCRPAIEQAER